MSGSAISPRKWNSSYPISNVPLQIPFFPSLFRSSFLNPDPTNLKNQRKQESHPNKHLSTRSTRSTYTYTSLHKEQRTPERILSLIDLNPKMRKRSPCFSSLGRQSDLTAGLSKRRRECLWRKVLKSLDIGVCAAVPARPSSFHYFRSFEITRPVTRVRDQPPFLYFPSLSFTAIARRFSTWQ